MFKLFLSLLISLVISASASAGTFKLGDGTYKCTYFYNGCAFLEISHGGRSIYYELRGRCSNKKGENVVFSDSPRFDGSTISVGDGVKFRLLKVTERSITGHWLYSYKGFAQKVTFSKVD